MGTMNSGLWVSKAVMGFEIHHGVRNAAWGLQRIKGSHGVVQQCTMGLDIYHGVRNASRGGTKEGVCV